MKSVTEKNINVALTSWEDRISPVFDAARTLLVVKIRNRAVVHRSVENFNPGIFHQLAELLSRLKIEVLICGAISEIPANIIEDSKVKLIPFISGNIEEVIKTYAKGEPIVPAFSMPGCGRRRQRGKIRVKHSENHMEVRSMPKGEGACSQGQGGGGKGTGGCGNKSGRGSGQGQGCGNKSGQGRGGGGNQGDGQGRAGRQMQEQGSGSKQP